MGKKLAIVLVALVIISFITLWATVPDQPQVAGKVFVKMPAAPLERGFLTIENWDSFFPGDTLKNNSFKIDDRIYNIIGRNVSSIDLEAYDEGSPEHKWIANIAVYHTSDSTFFMYQAKQARPTNNPFRKISSWFKMNAQDNQLNMICDAASNYFNSIEHIYGFKIIENKMADLTMLSTKMTTIDTPDVKSIYTLIGTLRDAIKDTDAEPIDSPMLNITRITEKELVTMVAIPISKDIPVHGNILLKKMIPGNKLETTVKGGELRLKSAYQAMRFYMEDQMKTAPAIPYQILMTNRLNTPDSLWITKINFPIF